MSFLHKDMAAGGWQKYSLCEQMANIGSEIERTMSWRNKGNVNYSRQAFERALELVDLTIDDPKNRKRLKEICRLREVLADYFAFENIYSSTDELWQKYFYAFNYAARVNVT
ncbi:MAG: hypothetical protein WC901_07925 [Candidatus Margulisiibacteriota bacterium]